MTTLFSRGPRGADYFQGGGFPDKTATTGHGISIYESSGAQKINWDILLPDDYKPVKDLLLDIYWFSVSVTTGAVRLDGVFEMLKEDGDPLTSDNFGTTVSDTFTVSSTLGALKRSTLTFTNAAMSAGGTGDAAPGDVMRYKMVRDTVHAGDTMTGDMAFLLWAARQV